MQPERYWDPTQRMWAVKILPGQFYAGDRDEVLVTILGSCISACIHDPVRHVGGMNHFMLPQEEGPSSWSGWGARYGSNAMELLINEILKRGGSRERLQVKLFGGGRVLSSLVSDVGGRNIDFALDYVQREGLRLVGKDLGEEYARKVRFFPQTGRVQMKQVHMTRNDVLAERERDYRRSLADPPQLSGTVELF